MPDLYQAKQVHEFFRGAERAFGTFQPSGELEGPKVKGLAMTQRGSITDQMWLNHLNGETPSLGIIPINEQSECYWGVIDVDDYALDFVELLDKISQTPLICCKSKSGGAWLFILSKALVSAKKMREYLTGMVGQLGLGTSEVFPKQEVVYTERGDVGNWLNMPYFGPTRHCVRIRDNSVSNGQKSIRELTLTEFIEYAKEKQVGINFWEKVNAFNYEASPVENGPPCLQIMSLTSFPEHTRNTALFNLGIYAKRAEPDDWVLVLHQFNKRFFTPPLPTKEVDTVVRSLNKKTYNYQCNQEPLCSFCNARLCRTRKYGIASTSALPIITSITKVVGDSSMWFIDVEGGRLSLSTDELHDFKRFSARCMNDLNILPNPIKPEQWVAWVQAQIEKAIEIKDDVMFSHNELHVNFSQFIQTRLAKEKDDVYNNRVFYFEDEKTVLFKIEAFIQFLHFRRINLPKAMVYMFLKNRGLVFTNGKTKDRRSFRYCTCNITVEEEILIQQKQGKGDVL